MGLIQLNIARGCKSQNKMPLEDKNWLIGASFITPLKINKGI